MISSTIRPKDVVSLQESLWKLVLQTSLPQRSGDVSSAEEWLETVLLQLTSHFYGWDAHLLYQDAGSDYSLYQFLKSVEQESLGGLYVIFLRAAILYVSGLVRSKVAPEGDDECVQPPSRSLCLTLISSTFVGSFESLTGFKSLNILVWSTLVICLAKSSR